MNFVFLCFLFLCFSLRCPSIILWICEVNQNWFWIKFCISFILCVPRLFDLSSLLPSFPSLILSFLFPFFSSIVVFVPLTVLSLFLSWLPKCSNLAIPLAITLCWKRNPGRGLDSFDPNKKNRIKKTTGSSNSRALGGEVWRFPTPLLRKEGQLRGDLFSFS